MKTKKKRKDVSLLTSKSSAEENENDIDLSKECGRKVTYVYPKKILLIFSRFFLLIVSKNY